MILKINKGSTSFSRKFRIYPDKRQVLSEFLLNMEVSTESLNEQLNLNHYFRTAFNKRYYYYGIIPFIKKWESSFHFEKSHIIGYTATKNKDACLDRLILCFPSSSLKSIHDPFVSESFKKDLYLLVPEYTIHQFYDKYRTMGGRGDPYYFEVYEDYLIAERTTEKECEKASKDLYVRDLLEFTITKSRTYMTLFLTY